MNPWTQHSTVWCDRARQMFQDRASKGWYGTIYPQKTKAHYRDYHAKEQDLTLVEDNFQGWYILTDNPEILEEYRKNKSSDSMTRISRLARNLDIAIVRETWGDRVAEDMRRLQFDLEQAMVD